VTVPQRQRNGKDSVIASAIPAAERLTYATTKATIEVLDGLATVGGS
jgi:hypothetical protein